MSVLTMFCWLGINLTDKKSLNLTLNQILNTVYLLIQNANIRPGVFLAKMRGHVRYGRPN